MTKQQLRTITLSWFLALLSASPMQASAESGSRVAKLTAAALQQTLTPGVYDPRYSRIPYPLGDLPADRGVCSDVVIRAYRALGIDLQQLVHEDMAAHFSQYPQRWQMRGPDSNIDHRRVPNLMTFFARHHASLPITHDAADYAEGDIVAWDLGGGVTHIGVLVAGAPDHRERPMVVHNIGAGPHREDVLFSWTIIGHYRYALS